jgi:PEP-CTERM motif
MLSLRKVIPAALAFLLLTMCFAASAKADTIENLVFTGTATCDDATCASYGTGALTGTYSLDVTTQTIVGAWSFTGPFGTMSSTEPGALAPLVDRFGDINPGFEEGSGVAAFVQFFFPLTDTTELGSVSATSISSDGCIYVSSNACDPDYIITGTVTAAPEPGTGILMLMGIGLIFMMRKRIVQGLQRAAGTHRSLPLPAHI